jgi:hypothetical protein
VPPSLTRKSTARVRILAEWVCFARWLREAAELDNHWQENNCAALCILFEAVLTQARISSAYPLADP